jgi:hypothetical protein
MRTVTWDDAIEVLATMSHARARSMIRDGADLRWMRDAAASGTLINYGVREHHADGVEWPILLFGLTRPATPSEPAARGAAVFQVVRNSMSVLSLACYPDVELARFAGDPNGPPGVLNGDFPWLYALAEPDAVAAGLAALSTRSRSLALA